MKSDGQKGGEEGKVKQEGRGGNKSEGKWRKE